jgi:starch synthase
MKVLYVCSELFPLLKTGGLADVSAALPQALRQVGCDVRILLPGFPAILAGVRHADLSPGDVPSQTALSLPAGAGPSSAADPAVRIIRAELPDSGMPCYVLDAPACFDRPGNPYLDAWGQPWPDNAGRFALLSWAAACLARGLDTQWQPDILHCHDWHTGLAPLYLSQHRVADTSPAASVFTIHNLAYQGVFPAGVFASLGLADHHFGIDGVEFYGQVSFMKAALQFADRITTVSPTYAREILTPEQGFGLDGVLRSRSAVLSGILNGVDYAVWSPAHDAVLAQTFDWRSVVRKKNAKKQLQAALGLKPDANALVLGVVSRLTEQKGLHLVAEVLDHALGLGAQLALIGGGDPGIEQAFVEAANKYPGQVSVTIGYDENLAHSIIAGSDVILVPSRFEPCGLTQLYGLRYGTLPLVHRVGGLADTVVDASPVHLEDASACGFVFDDFSAQGLLTALVRAHELHARPEVWKTVQINAMKLRFDWQVAATQYLALYRSLKPHAL